MTVLISRLSALGDVIISIPIVLLLRQQYPDLKIIYLTKKNNSQLFTNIENIILETPDFENTYNGINGILKLFFELKKKYKIDLFIDLHDVIRTKILRKLFKLSGVKVYKINKGRREKKLLTRKNNKIIKRLKTTYQRYLDTFDKAGLKIISNKVNYPIQPYSEIDNLIQNKEYVIVAPFAAHQNKIYPLDKLKVLIEYISQRYYVFVLGAGNKEKQIAKQLENSKVLSIIGIFSLKQELYLISKAAAIITMDSANMHLASLTNTKILSIWGPTHPYIGFIPYNSENIIFIQKPLDCRPCSVFGDKKCYKKTRECMDIDPFTIIKTFQKIL